ncbi:MAG: YgiQ family radical SAM protein [Candidatus Limisoma sp.]|nr:YgiQ family radical SAM protein [Bacteroidales bacterium]MDY4941635.1 YgiQ family radical SAM protein [Candidatus Limisoma sp.]MDY5893928.1 YgiQ family radical SAM protein [Candidatus Limisoma sp.]MDY5899588.1 YgiQ family radical SAM protein [Candidatus Limisoma sp.]MDY5998784.1 YgiQ family radical SAM protein [Candidatus Limisoma sp.]
MEKDNYVQRWLPITKKEIDRLGWDYVDVILFSGDAYIDHPSMGCAVIGRVLEAHGYRVAIVPQPNWQDDLRDFKKFGRPRLFFGVSAGAMDSMVNHYTAARRRRSDDAYTPNGRHGARPDYPTIVYSKILKTLFPDVPVVAGGIEASLRRLSHYDYWEDRLRPSILMDCRADMLVYGMGERSIVEIADSLAAGKSIGELTDVPQTAVVCSKSEMPGETDDTNCILNSFEICLKDKVRQAENFKHIEIESNKWHGRTIWQQYGDRVVKINPMYPPMTENEIDASFDLPYTRLPHPKYNGKTIPAYEMIRHSVNMHRGCFGGCAFCTISAHQGKFIASRSKASILSEVKQITQMPDFKGYISDLGGPSANMYRMHGRDLTKCRKCVRPSCLHPQPCSNLNNDHAALLDIYEAVDALPGVKKSFIGSGVRYDLAMARNDDDAVNRRNRRYIQELIVNHVSGRLKVAPEHTSDEVLNCMRKPSFDLFRQFDKIFNEINEKYNLRQQLIPYFISSHPACRETDMAELAVQTKRMNFRLEQVQDFTPTPMTVSSEIYYSGVHPYTLKKVYTARSADEKQNQRKYFFWYKPECINDIRRSLTRLHRQDLINELFGKTYKRK